VRKEAELPTDIFISLIKIISMTIMKYMNIDKLLEEAETGKRSAIVDRITDEAKPFWQGCEERVAAGRELKPYVVSRLLRDEFGIKISESAVRNHFQNIAEANE
jgi:hypothetical protein